LENAHLNFHKQSLDILELYMLPVQGLEGLNEHWIGRKASKLSPPQSAEFILPDFITYKTI